MSWHLWLNWGKGCPLTGRQVKVFLLLFFNAEPFLHYRLKHIPLSLWKMHGRPRKRRCHHRSVTDLFQGHWYKPVAPLLWSEGTRAITGVQLLSLLPTQSPPGDQVYSRKALILYTNNSMYQFIIVITITCLIYHYFFHVFTSFKMPPVPFFCVKFPYRSKLS